MAALAACAESPAEKHLLLSIEKDGLYTLDGKRVETARLVDAFKGASEGRPFDLTISASSQARYEPIGKAVAAAHEAGVSGIRLDTASPSEAASAASR